MPGHAEWHGRARFAEYAEAAKVKTDSVLLATGAIVLLHTDEEDDLLDATTPVFVSVLLRDMEDDTLRRIHRFEHPLSLGAMMEKFERGEQVL